MPIVVDEIDEPEVWALLKWMAERSADWVLIGGLMVATFDIEHGHPWRQTHDVDSLFDVRRAARGAILAAATSTNYARSASSSSRPAKASVIG